MPFLRSAGRFACRPACVRGCGQHLVRVGGQGVAACCREDTGDMNPERAEVHLRLLAEAELRRATSGPADVGLLDGCRSARLELVARALHAVHAFDMGAANEIQAELALALGVRQPRQGPGGLPPDAQANLARLMHRPPRPGAARQPPSPHARWRVQPVGQVIRARAGDVRGELDLPAYAQTAAGARFTAVSYWARHRARRRSGTRRRPACGSPTSSPRSTTRAPAISSAPASRPPAPSAGGDSIRRRRRRRPHRQRLRLWRSCRRARGTRVTPLASRCRNWPCWPLCRPGNATRAPSSSGSSIAMTAQPGTGARSGVPRRQYVSRLSHGPGRSPAGARQAWCLFGGLGDDRAFGDEHLMRRFERVQAGGDAAVDGRVQQDLFDLLDRDAVVQRALHVEP